MKTANLAEFFKQTARTDRGCLYIQAGALEKQWVSYYTLYQQAESRAKQLAALSLPPRFIAVLWMDQSPASMAAFISVILANGIPVPLHPASKGEEAAAIIRKLEAEIVLLSEVQVQQIQRIASEGSEEGSYLGPMYWLEGESGEKLDASILSAAGSRRPRVRQYSPPSQTAVIFMSSGSTGVPKGILLTEKNLLSNVEAIQAYLHITEMDHILLTKSMGYCSTITGEWLLALLTGANLQMAVGFAHPLQIVGLIRDHHSSFMCTVPSTLIPLLKLKKWNIDALISLKKLIIVGGQMPAELLVQLRRLLSWIEIMPCYGLTEASPRVSYLPGHSLALKPNSVGIPIQGVEITIYLNGQPNPPGEIGEVIVNGPNLMLGYYNDPIRSEKVLAAYGLRTADIGYLDEEGYLFITGRLDNALNVAGHSIYPESIEQVISNHPWIQEVAVTGIADQVWGQLPIAYVVPTESGAAEPSLLEELYQYCQQHLSSVQRPKEIIQIQQLPKRVNGKLDRRRLQFIVKEQSDASTE
ncbi:class I adenylate-forming enzyme family protein [Paenibacillus oryzisoli]|uniref:class I adenylate-forming enzyme family protein n=1 Tax=Paenibacillus oryzisoli TaxID=1850517 RepID=UPI003D2B2B18